MQFALILHYAAIPHILAPGDGIMNMTNSIILTILLNRFCRSYQFVAAPPLRPVPSSSCGAATGSET